MTTANPVTEATLNQLTDQEIAQEYFANPVFRKALEQYVWDLNNPK